MAKIGRKTVRRARRQRKWAKAMPNLKHSMVIPVRQRVTLNFPNGPNAQTIAINRFKSATATGVYSYGNNDAFTQRKNSWE